MTVFRAELFILMELLLDIQVTLSQKRKADRVLQRPTWKQVRQIISLPSSNFHTAEINLLVAHKHSKASWKLRLSQGYSG